MQILPPSEPLNEQLKKKGSFQFHIPLASLDFDQEMGRFSIGITISITLSLGTMRNNASHTFYAFKGH